MTGLSDGIKSEIVEGLAETDKVKGKQAARESPPAVRVTNVKPDSMRADDVP